MNNRTRPLVGALSAPGAGALSDYERLAPVRQAAQVPGMGALSDYEVELIRQHRASSQRNSPTPGAGAMSDHEARHIPGAGAASDHERSAPWWSSFVPSF